LYDIGHDIFRQTNDISHAIFRQTKSFIENSIEAGILLGGNISYDISHDIFVLSGMISGMPSVYTISGMISYLISGTTYG
jgi:hypothetical protein